MSASSSALASISTDLRSGMRLRDDRRAREQAVRERLRDGARLGRARLRRVLDVLREQLDGVADLVERDDLLGTERIPGHHAAVDPVLADALAHVRLEEVDLVELVGRDLDPDLVVLLPELEEAGNLLRVLDDVGEGLRLARRDGRGGGRGGGSRRGRGPGGGRTRRGRFRCRAACGLGGSHAGPCGIRGVGAGAGRSIRMRGRSRSRKARRQPRRSSAQCRSTVSAGAIEARARFGMKDLERMSERSVGGATVLEVGCRAIA